jgi:hypothetical protein
LALSGIVQFQERIQFARCKPRTHFAREEGMIARINCKILIARVTTILQFWTKCQTSYSIENCSELSTVAGD